MREKIQENFFVPLNFFCSSQNFLCFPIFLIFYIMRHVEQRLHFLQQNKKNNQIRFPSQTLFVKIRCGRANGSKFLQNIKKNMWLFLVQTINV